MEETVSIASEELQIGKRTVETGVVRIAKRVEEHEQNWRNATATMTFRFERVTFNCEANQAQGTRQEGDVMIVPIYDEVLVATRQLKLKEELRITRSTKMKRSVSETFTLRSEQIRRHADRNMRLIGPVVKQQSVKAGGFSY